MVVGEPVGVASERGFLRQHRHPGEQGGCGVGEQVVDVGDAPGAGQLERQQGQQPVHCGDDPGAGSSRAETSAGRSRAARSGMASSSPARTVFLPLAARR